MPPSSPQGKTARSRHSAFVESRTSTVFELSGLTRIPSRTSKDSSSEPRPTMPPGFSVSSLMSPDSNWTRYMSNCALSLALTATSSSSGKRLFVMTFWALAPSKGVRSRAFDPSLLTSTANRWKFSSPPSSCRYNNVFESSAQKIWRMPLYESSVTTRSSPPVALRTHAFKTPSTGFRYASLEPSGVTEGAAYSGLPKRTSLGTNSASAAENFMAVRVGRLRGAVNAAADAAIATRTAANLLIAAADAAIATKTFAKLLLFEKMSAALIFCKGD